MRLTEEHKNKLIALAKNCFEPDFKLYLFGSRVDESKKGGDIDLFIDSNHDINIQQQIHFLREINKNITQRKVDLVVKTPNKKYRKIFDTAINEGILLC